MLGLAGGEGWRIDVLVRGIVNRAVIRGMNYDTHVCVESVGGNSRFSLLDEGNVISVHH